MRQNNYQGTLQQPLCSGFNATTTAADVIAGIDLAGKIAIVTGGNTGIGLETTKTLVKAGATVIVPARDLQKARKNLSGLSNVEIEPMDLMDPDSIDRFAAQFLATSRPLDLLINNAGIMWVPLRRDSRGIESQLATNYLAAFRLTARLWPALVKAQSARVVNVSSAGHQFAPFDFEDPNFLQRQYETLLGYGQSKTALNLFTVELDNRARQTNIKVFSLNPGSIAGTELGREASLELLQRMGFLDADGNLLPEVAARLKTVAQGAATTVWCATSAALDHIGGVYCEDADIAGLAANASANGVGMHGVEPYSLNAVAARKLWAWTGEITGISFLND